MRTSSSSHHLNGRCQCGPDQCLWTRCRAQIVIVSHAFSCFKLINWVHTYPFTQCRSVQIMAALAMRGMFFAGSFHRVKISGRQASPKEAPILTLAPHSSYFDSISVVLFGPPSVLAKAETGLLPFFGSKFNAIGSIGATFTSIIRFHFQNWSISRNRFTCGARIRIHDKILSKRSSNGLIHKRIGNKSSFSRKERARIDRVCCHSNREHSIRAFQCSRFA